VNKKTTVAVIFGGKSPEHEVSIITGVQVLNQIDKDKFDVIPIYVSKEGIWYVSDYFYEISTFKDLSTIQYKSFEAYMLPWENNSTLFIKTSGLFKIKRTIKRTIDVFFPCFHGNYGENGSFQGLFELIETPYVGSGVLGSALGMDKVLMKQLFEVNNIPIAPYIWFYKHTWDKEKEAIINKAEKNLGYPMFIKPSCTGSSIGVAKTSTRSQLIEAVEVAAAFDNKIIIEKSIENAKEINISVIGNNNNDLIVSECEEVFSSKNFLDYSQKYTGKDGRSKGMASTNREIPAKIKANEKEKVQKLAIEVFKTVNASGLARIDFLLSEKNTKLYVTEINTIPGSMSFYLWEASNLKFSHMIDKLINLAIEKYRENEKLTYEFPNNILKDFKGSLKGPKIR